MMGNVFKKFVIVNTALVSIIGVAVYLIIFSPQIANKYQIIQIRHGYERVVVELRNWLRLPMADHCSKMATPIRVLTGLGEEGGFRYSLQGRLEAIDSKGSMVTLLCSNGKSYTFIVELKPGTEQGKVVIVGVSDEGTGRRKNKWVFSVRDKDYDQSQIYDMVWEDSRTLAQILSEHKQNPSEAINKNAEVRVEIKRY
jgi:hypothetical protein